MSYGIGPHDTDCQCDRCQSRRKQFNLCNKRVGNSYCSLNVGHDGKCTVESLPVPATPGPWKIYDAGRDDNLFIESNGRGSVCKLARKGPDQRDRDLELANARLIAAAPELLESLKYMVAVSNWATTIQSNEQYDEMIATAEAAIRKVEGR